MRKRFVEKVKIQAQILRRQESVRVRVVNMHYVNTRNFQTIDLILYIGVSLRIYL